MDKVPALGEHSASILRELGVSNERIDEMHRERIVQSINAHPPAT